MQNSTLLIALLAIGGLIYWSAQPEVPPTPGPTPVAGPDLLTPFRASHHPAQAREHAQAFAAICGDLADVLDFDARQEKPRIKTGVQIDDLRMSVREMQMRGWSFGATYPQLGPAIDAYMRTAVGTSGGALTPEQKQQWIAAFRVLEQSASYASSQL